MEPQQETVRPEKDEIEVKLDELQREYHTGGLLKRLRRILRSKWYFFRHGPDGIETELQELETKIEAPAPVPVRGVFARMLDEIQEREEREESFANHMVVGMVIGSVIFVALLVIYIIYTMMTQTAPPPPSAFSPAVETTGMVVDTLNTIGTISITIAPVVVVVVVVGFVVRNILTFNNGRR